MIAEDRAQTQALLACAEFVLSAACSLLLRARRKTGPRRTHGRVHLLHAAHIVLPMVAAQTNHKDQDFGTTIGRREYAGVSLAPMPSSFRLRVRPVGENVAP